MALGGLLPFRSVGRRFNWRYVINVLWSGTWFSLAIIGIETLGRIGKIDVLVLSKGLEN